MAEKILLFAPSSEGMKLSPWRFFDPEWYSQYYSGLREAMTEQGYGEKDFLSFYQEVGVKWGHSPNVFFDEIWFRSLHPDFLKTVNEDKIVSGFQFYCEKAGQENSPHWLFDETLYARQVFAAGVTNFKVLGFENGWAHYLAEGEKAGFAPSPFFDLELVGRIARRYPAYFKGKGLLEGWLGLPPKIADLYRVSWYFDPRFYLETYPEAVAEIALGKFVNALHRYLSLAPLGKENPSPYFDEIYYRQANADIIPFIERGNFHNGFDHFLRCGAKEGRSPLAEIDLKAYGALPIVRSQCQSGAWDSGFERFIAEKNGCAAESGFFSAPFSEKQTKIYFRESAKEVSKSLILKASESESKLDFSCLEMPILSVIIVAYNQIDLTLQTLFSLRKNYQGNIEVILVNSGSSDFVRKISLLLKGVRIVHFEENIGYLRACNHAFSLATASKILLLNNDVRLFPQAIEKSLSLMESDFAIGAVCARLVRPPMILQEAGSILWQDGSAYGYRREDNPNISEALFQREIDYGSAAFLLLSKKWVEKLGGFLFDEDYLPAYFEDTDLCVRLRKAGARVLYEPSCLVEHLEFGTSGSEDSHTLIQRNLRKFIHKHQDWLKERPQRTVLNALKGRDPVLFGKKGKERRQILFIEDVVPLHRLGSGYGRSADIIQEMVHLGWKVTIFPIFKTREPAWRFLGEFPDNVEIMSEWGLENLKDFLEERTELYDLIWVGRTHNWVRVRQYFKRLNLSWASLPVILDTEVVAAPRTLTKNFLEETSLEKSLKSAHDVRDLKNEKLRALLEDEFRITHDCTEIICVNEDDASLAKEVAWPPVKVLGHLMPSFNKGEDFQKRDGLLFFGALHSQDSPNYDSLLWLTQEILPELDMLNGGEEIRVTIAGFIGEDIDLLPLSGRKNLHFVGAVDDPEALFNQHRVFIAPTRYAGGLPYKLHEAAARGLPIVATDILERQLGWKNGETLLSVPVGESKAFAKSALALNSDPILWEKLRENSLKAVYQDCDVKKFRKALAEVLEIVFKNIE
ncbi:glycosyltransferase [Acetobacteraceae bacterium]|nr:glycosyltransferase [Acetobacteraceae bacterium]